MTPTELRLTNYVYANDKIDLIKKIEDTSIEVFGCSDMVQVIKPIPITEKWLLNFGFKKVSDKGLKYFKQVNRQGFIVVPSEYDSETLSPTEKSEYFVNYECDIACGFDLLCYVENVHQLQNLFYALSGEELVLT